MKPLLHCLMLMSLAAALYGCGEEGPFGNTPPQGRPDWMKDANKQ